MELLSPYSTLLVKQQHEFTEVFSNIESANRYQVFDDSGQLVCLAVEESKGYFSRQFFGPRRPFTIHVATGTGVLQLIIKRKFTFYFHQIEVFDPQGALLGTVVRQYSVAHRLYKVFDAQGRECYSLVGPILKPWTFLIKRDSTELGKIRKQWSGALKEIHTDADNFGVEFPKDLDTKDKALLFAGVFLIDFVHFEKKS